MSKKSETVKVVVRCRPLNGKEKSEGAEEIVKVDNNRGEIILTNPKQDGLDPSKIFTFDKAYDSTSTQEQIYMETAYPLVESVLEGYNATIFAYGQTGTGKTHTMEGTEDNKGIMYRAFDHIFKHIQGTPDTEFLVYASYLELYMEEIQDLLVINNSKLPIREDKEKNVYVQNLSKAVVKSAEETYQKLLKGSSKRHTSSHDENDRSSRSHAIFTVTVEASKMGIDGKNHIRVGKLNLVDLAGSERQKKTNATGKTAEEGILINKSLVVLGTVISNLSTGETFVPYRDSPLTRLLQNSLGGNSKTLMIANIGPSSKNYSESGSTLMYASRAKSIKQQPKVNEDPTSAMLKEFQDEISKLRSQLAQFQGGDMMAADKTMIVQVNDEQKIKEMEEQLAKEKEEIRKRHAQERKKIEDAMNMEIEEKAKILEVLKSKEEQERLQAEKQEEMLRKLSKMEEKVLKGKEAMKAAIQKEKKHQKMLQELEEKRLAEKKYAEELIKEEENDALKSTYKNQQEELEDLRKKFAKLHKKYLNSQTELREREEELYRERDYYQENEREWDKVNKLKDLIIGSFIPDAEINRIEMNAYWDADRREWLLPKQNLTGNNVRRPGSAIGLLRPRAEITRVAREMGDPNPRYRDENIISVPLDMPERNLQEFDGSVSKKIQDTLNRALDSDEDILNQQAENKPNVYLSYDDEIGERRAEPGVKKRINTAKRKTMPVQDVRERDRGGDMNYLMEELGEGRGDDRDLKERASKKDLREREAREVRDSRGMKENPPDKEYPRAKGLLGRQEKKL